MRDGAPDKTLDLAAIAKDYDWQHVFACANAGRYVAGYGEADADGCDGYESNCDTTPKRVTGATCGEERFRLADVEVIFDARPGEDDGAEWLIAGVLKDGRFFFIDAGCDYTGWDCRGGGTSWVSDTLRRLHDFGLTDEAREHLPGVASALAGGMWP